MDTNGKVVEVMLVGDDNGFFDFFAKWIKQTVHKGSDLVPQKDKQKSIVVRGNEFWVCQSFYNPNAPFNNVYEINVYANMNNDMVDMHVVMKDGEIPDTDIYKVGILSFWVALGDFLGIPTTISQRRQMAEFVNGISEGCFVYEEQRHDIRSYRLGRSATIQEIALLLSVNIK